MPKLLPLPEISRWTTLLFIVGSILARLIDHWPNVSPIAAVALIGGATLPLSWAVFVPLAAMLVSDKIIGFDVWQITVAVYVSFAATVLIGRWLLKGSAGRVLSSSLLSSSLFYLVTNFAVWAWGGLYPATLEGLLWCYTYAIPFFRNTLLGDVLFTSSLYVAVRFVPALLRSLQVKAALVHKPAKATV